MFERNVLRGLMLAMGLALVVALLLPLVALADKGGPGTSAVGHSTISGDPLTIHVAQDTSIQVFYAGKPDGQVYPPGEQEADSGGLAWLSVPGVPTQVYGPFWAGHDMSAANPVNPWLSAGPQTVLGSGTAADPWWIGTFVTAMQIYTVDQWVRYVDGDDCFRVSYTLTDIETEEPTPFNFFHAADLWPDDRDNAYGYYNAATGAVGGWNQDMTFLEYFVPVTEMGLPPASHYQEANWAVIWNRIGSMAGPGLGFNDTIRSDWHNSGAGFEWHGNLPGVQPPGNFVEFALDWCFLLEEEPPPPEFVPEPGSVILLASGLMGLAGYAGLRLRKK